MGAYLNQKWGGAYFQGVKVFDGEQGVWKPIEVNSPFENSTVKLMMAGGKLMFTGYLAIPTNVVIGQEYQLFTIPSKYSLTSFPYYKEKVNENTSNFAGDLYYMIDINSNNQVSFTATSSDYSLNSQVTSISGADISFIQLTLK
jgi:hypothetical protein